MEVTVLCSLVEIDRCFGGAYCVHHKGNDCLDGGSKHL
jgi:hypothetical protein